MTWHRWWVDLDYAPAVVKAQHAAGKIVKLKVHELGSVTVMFTAHGTARGYEVWMHNVCIGHARTAELALVMARSKRPKKDRIKLYKHEGEIVAYRGWNMIGDILVPLSRSEDVDTWAGPVARAEIYSDSSGLWALKIERGPIRRMVHDYEPEVHGFVGLSGRVVEHQIGYRAIIATVRLLRVTIPCSDKFLGCLEDRYQCQVMRAKSTTDLEWSQ